MQELWSTELTPDEEEQLLKSLVEEVRRRKLEAPAIILLEMHKPLAYVGSQAAIAFSPFLVPFVGLKNLNDYSRLFSKRENFERLIRLLEESAPPEGEVQKDLAEGAVNGTTA